MKTKHLIISGLLVLGTIAACKKEKTTPTTPEPTNPNLSKNGCVLTETYGEQFNKPSFLRPWKNTHSTALGKQHKTSAQVLREKFFYDAVGRVSKIEVYETDSTGTAKIEYTETFAYSAENISLTGIEYDEQGNPIDSTKRTLTAPINGFGFITSVSDKSPDGDEYTATYEYNTEGYLTKENSQFSYSYEGIGGTTIKSTRTAVIIYQYTNGNLSKETETYTQTTTGQPTTNGSYTSTYEYDSQLMQSNFISENAPFLGKFNKNLVKKKTEEYIVDNNPIFTDVITYTYELDAKGNVTKQLTTYNGASEPDVNTYTYQCK